MSEGRGSSSSFSRGVAWMTMGNWSEQAVNLLVFTLLLRLLPAESFGLLSMAMALVLIGEGLVRETLSEYVFSARDPDPDSVNTSFWALVVLGLALTLLLVLLAPLLARFYHAPLVAPLLWVSAPIVFLTAVTAVPVALLRHEMRLRPLAQRAFFGVVAGGIVGVGFALAGAGVWALAAQRIVLTLTNVVLAWQAVDWRPGPWPGLEKLRRFLPFSFHVLILRGAELASVQMPTILIGALLGSMRLGYFTMAWRIVELASFLIITPVRTAALPAFAARRGQLKGRIDPLFLDTLRLVGFLAIPAFVGLAAVAQETVLLFGGPNWWQAAPALAMLALYGIPLCLGKIEEAYAFAHGRARELATLSGASAIVVSIGLVVLSRFGLVAMEAVIVAVGVALSPMRWLLVCRTTGFSVWPFIRQQLGPIVASLVMLAAILLVAPWTESLKPIAALSIKVAVGATVYVAIAGLTMRRRLRMAMGYIRDMRHGQAPRLDPDADPERKGDAACGPSTS